MTQSAFKPKNSHLDVIREHNTHKEEDDEEDDTGKDGNDTTQNPDEDSMQIEEGGRAIGNRVKRGV